MRRVGDLIGVWLRELRHMAFLVKAFFADEAGATAIEYGLIAALISVVIVTVLTTIGTQLNGVFTSVSNGLGSN
jgi:pilus assembly protein Flp/PilA